MTIVEHLRGVKVGQRVQGTADATGTALELVVLRAPKASGGEGKEK